MSNTSASSGRWPHYTLVLLSIVYIFNFVDRQILVILQESIKADMGLSDSQLGLMTGFTFAIFYVSAGIPIARLADRSNRRNIVAWAIAIWSGMTALSGLAQNFWQMLLARIGVGIGEAGGSPPAHSMISDIYPPHQRGTALAFYTAAIYIGIMVGYLVGGWVDQHYGWRIAFFVVGIPGLLIALLVRYTITEPVRGQQDEEPVGDAVSLKETLKTLKSMRSFVFLAIGSGLASFSSYGTGNFMPSFFARSHGMEPADIGVLLAFGAGIGGGLGAFFAGWLADRVGKDNKRWYAWIASIGQLMAIPMGLTVLYSENMTLIALGIGFGSFFGIWYLGPILAMAHTLVRPNMRAMTSAILFFILNLIGLGGGPLITGLMSDILSSSYGTESLRYSLTIMTFSGIFAAFFFWLGAKYLMADLKK